MREWKMKAQSLLERERKLMREIESLKNLIMRLESDIKDNNSLIDSIKLKIQNMKNDLKNAQEKYDLLKI